MSLIVLVYYIITDDRHGYHDITCRGIKDPDAEAIGPVAHILIHMADGGSAQLYIKVISQQITGDHQFLTVNGTVHITDFCGVHGC